MILGIQCSSSKGNSLHAFGNPQVQSTPCAGGTSSSSTQSYKPTTSWTTPSSTAVAAGTSGATATSAAGSSSGNATLNRVGVPSFNASKPFAISYSPYMSSGGCKSVSAIASDLQAISAAGFQCIRLYGTDCNQVSNVLSAISSIGCSLKLFLGIFDLDAASSEASTIVSALNGNWSKVVTVSVGNEPVNSGQASVSTVLSTTSAVRSQLRR